MKDKLNNALNEINDKYIEEAATADRLERSPAKAIKYIAGGTAAVAAVAAICVGLNHLGVFNRGVDLVDSLPSTSQDSPSSDTPESTYISEIPPSENHQSEFEYYWEESMPLVSVTQDYIDNLIFGSEFPYMLYASEEKAVFTDGVGGIYIYSFTENKLTLAADINKNIEFIKDNCPYEFFNIDPNNSSPAPTVNFQCGIDGEIICSVTYYAEVPSTKGHTATEYKAFPQYYRINEGTMTMELYDIFPLTDYALYGGLRDVTEANVEGAISYNVATIDGTDKCVYITLDNTNEDMLLNVKLHKRDTNDNEITFKPFDGYLAKTIYLGETYLSMLPTTTSTYKNPELCLYIDGTFKLTHIFGDDTLVRGNYLVAGDVVRLISYPISSPMQPIGEAPEQRRGTVWYLRFDESNALWADENSFATMPGYALANDKVLFLKQNNITRYISMGKTVNDGFENDHISAMLALVDNGSFNMMLDSAGNSIDLTGTYTQTDTSVTLNTDNGKTYTFTKDGFTLTPDDTFIEWLLSNPDHPACKALLEAPTLYDINKVDSADITNDGISVSSEIKQTEIEGKNISYRLRLDLIADNIAILYFVPEGEDNPISDSIIVDNGTHRIENGKFILTMEDQESELTLSADHPSLYENVMNNVSTNFDPCMNNPYSERIYILLASRLSNNEPLTLPETGNGMAAFCDKVSMANEPQAILSRYDGYVIRSTTDNSTTVVDKDNFTQYKNVFFADSEALMEVSAEGEYYVVRSTIGNYATDGTQIKKYYIRPDTHLIERIDIYNCIKGDFVFDHSLNINFILADDSSTLEQIDEEIEYQNMLNEKADALNKEIKTLQEHKELLDEQAEDINKEIDALQAMNENTDTHKQNLENLQKEKADLDEKIKRLNEEIAAITNDLEKLSAKIDRHQEHTATFADVDRELLNEFVGKIAANHKGAIVPPQKWIFPTESEYITTYFGYDSWRGGVHDGIDIAEEGGKPIRAVADGTAYVGSNDNSWFGGYGNTVAVLHDGGYITVYSCAYEILVKDGERVAAGQTIATVGTTGASTGNHLHFEMRKGTTAVNPFSIPYNGEDKNINNILTSALNASEPTLPESLTYPLPAEYTSISEGMGDNGYIGHAGIDIPAPTGTEVYAADNGEVIYADWLGGYGNCVILKHSNGCFTVYAHLSQVKTAQGKTIAAGETLGLVGSTGQSTGQHLHFELRKGTSPVDPTTLLGL